MSANAKLPLPEFAKLQGARLTLDLHVQPGAKRSGIVGLHGAKLKVAVAAAPSDGEANQELISFLAEFFETSKRSVCLERGHQSRQKLVSIQGVTEEKLTRLLDELQGSD